MNTIKNVISETESFFEKHWCKNVEIPQWIGDWKWEGSVPNHDKVGVYALINENGEVVYIGVGASRGGGQYKNHGLSYRLLNHVITTDKGKRRGCYIAKERWKDVKEIYTIGFPVDSYMSLALEDYLIAKLQPTRNINKK
ncbi:MAG: hypothetical protein PHI79_05920 [Sulfurovaceae bacterium]|nr:hypothetical protein [Sulfurovaceae bacterium]MDD5549115.1 hypothetical protein [Sulfurovaceae bacterium]